MRHISALAICITQRITTARCDTCAHCQQYCNQLLDEPNNNHWHQPQPNRCGADRQLQFVKSKFGVILQHHCCCQYTCSAAGHLSAPVNEQQ